VRTGCSANIDDRHAGTALTGFFEEAGDAVDRTTVGMPEVGRT
jgi:hypothetical protein